MTFDHAKKLLIAQLNPEPLGTEKIPLTKAYSRILSEDVITKVNIPPFDRSTVDGFAVRAEDIYEAEENKPTILSIIGTINVGEPPKIEIRKNQTVEIVTGAPIPIGA